MVVVLLFQQQVVLCRLHMKDEFEDSNLQQGGEVA